MSLQETIYAHFKMVSSSTFLQQIPQEKSLISPQLTQKHFWCKYEQIRKEIAAK